MNTLPLPERCLLVKAQTGPTMPYALEDLRTGWRREYGDIAELLKAIDGILRSPNVPGSTSERCN